MAKLIIKEGVQPRLLRLVAAALSAADACGLASITITAGIDGVHGADSLHYALRAIDIRTHDMPTPGAFVDAFRATAGKGHFIFLESPGTPAEHVHAEFDPK